MFLESQDFCQKTMGYKFYRDLVLFVCTSRDVHDGEVVP